METRVRVRHVYVHEPGELEKELNEAIQRIIAEDGVIGDIKYAVDPSTGPRVRGGFGALIVYEIPTP